MRLKTKNARNSMAGSQNAEERFRYFLTRFSATRLPASRMAKDAPVHGPKKEVIKVVPKG